MSFKKSFFKTASGFAVYSYFTQAFEFGSTIILSRLLLPEEYGFVAIIGIFSGFILLFSNVGIGSSVIRSDYGQTFQRYLYSLSIWIGFALALIMILLAYPISVFFEKDELLIPTMVFSLKFIFDSFSYIPMAVLTKKLKFNVIGRVNLLSGLFSIILTVILAYLGFSYWSIIIPLILGPLLKYFIVFREIDFRLKIYNLKTTIWILNKIKVLMGSLSINNFVEYWAGSADKLVIGKYYTNSDLGLYNRAFRFIEISNKLVVSIFSMVMFPSIKKLITEGGDVSKEYLDLVRFIIISNMPIIFILILVPEQLVNLLWGKDWLDVSMYLPYVGIMIIFHFIQGNMRGLYILYEKEKSLIFINAAIAGIKIILVAWGSLYSMIHIMIFLCIGFIFVTTPLLVYHGFHKSFKFPIGLLVRFWSPISLSGLILLASVYYDQKWISLIILITINSMMLFDSRNSIKNIFKIIKIRIKRSN